MDDRLRAFLEDHHAAAMTTLRADGTPHVARVGIGLLGDRLLSSGTRDRVRTRHLRRDPRCTLFVFDDQNPGAWAGVETTAAILDGPDVPDQSLRFFRSLQVGIPNLEPGQVMWFGRPMAQDEFLEAMRSEGRVLYEFEVRRAYGMYGA